MTPTFEVFDTPGDVAAAAADRVATLMERAVAQRGRFVMAVSGGMTPRPLYRLLASPPLATALPWARVHVFMADERNLLPSHPDSNYRLVREMLLDRVAIPPDQVHRIRTELPPHQAAEAHSHALRDVLGDDGLDLVVLGLGRDGHTASLWPGSPALYADARGAVATFVAALDDWRVTLTLPELNHADTALFLVTGSDKAATLTDIRTGVSGLPAARVQPAGGRALWLVDRAADQGPPLAHASDTMATVEGRKRAAAETAAALVTSGMVVGLGTGSTARYAVELLARRLHAGDLSEIVGVPTSVATARLARDHRLPLVTLDDHPTVDITIDGADEVSPELDLIKGLGGALLREKIVANASRQLFIAVDDAKLVTRLGERAPVPVAVTPFGYRHQLDWLRQLGCEPSVRLAVNGQPFVSDDGNLLIDLRFANGILAPASLDRALDTRPGIVESGLFLGMTDAVFVASPQGVRILRRGDPPLER
jgi:ribose 5-phosphate isomerase A